MIENLAEIAPRVMAKSRGDMSHDLAGEAAEIIRMAVTAVAAADGRSVGIRLPKTGQGVFGLLSLRRSRKAGRLVLKADSLNVMKNPARDIGALIGDCFPQVCRGSVPRWIAAYDRDLARAKEFSGCWCWAACWVVVDFTDGKIGKANGGFKVFPMSVEESR